MCFFKIMVKASPQKSGLYLEQKWEITQVTWLSSLLPIVLSQKLSQSQINFNF